MITFHWFVESVSTIELCSAIFQKPRLWYTQINTSNKSFDLLSKARECFSCERYSFFLFNSIRYSLRIIYVDARIHMKLLSSLEFQNSLFRFR